VFHTVNSDLFVEVILVGPVGLSLSLSLSLFFGGIRTHAS
jgi:hypothetical protein